MKDLREEGTSVEFIMVSESMCLPNLTTGSNLRNHMSISWQMLSCDWPTMP